MKLPLIASLAGLVVPFGVASAATFYVSADGSNSNAGTESAPFATVARGISASSSNDTIMLERGSVFRESGLSLSGGRTIDAYGDTGEPLPVITGSVLVEDWQAVTGGQGLYQADFSETVSDGEALVFVNGERQTLARYPDTGWLRVDEGTTANTLVDAELEDAPMAGSGQWNGAQVRWRKWSWWYETRPITSDNGQGSLSLGGSSAIANLTGIDSGYYIDDHRDALTTAGEWFWNQSTDTLLLFPPEGVDARIMTVEVAVESQGIALSGGATLRNVNVRHYTNRGVSIGGAATVEDCVIEHIWNNGINGSWGAAGTQIRGNVIRDILNVGISWNENPGGPGGTIMERNRIIRSGTVPGLGGNGPWHAAGVILINAPFGDNGVQFRLNRIDGTGYAGIILGGDGQTVERNVFRNCMNTLNDGAAIYTNCSYSFIYENIILDVEGDLDSSQPWTPLGAGIWLEFLENFHDSEVVGNTVYGSGGDGLFLPNNYNCLIEDNVFLSNLQAGMTLGGHEDGRGGSNNQDHTVRDNIVGIGAIPWEPSGEYRNLASWGDRDDSALRFAVHDDRDLDFGTLSGTTFLTQDGEDLVTNTSNREYTISEWQEFEDDWADPSPANVEGDAYLFINDTESTVDFPLPEGVAWTDLDGNATGSAVEIAPFRSAVLLSPDGVVAGLSGYQLYTEEVMEQTWEQWLEQYDLTGNDAEPGTDSDGDGYANGIEYALNTSPVSLDSMPVIEITWDGATPVNEFSVRRDMDLDFEVQTSQNLNNWTAQTPTEVETGVHPVTDRYRIALDPTTKPFLRFVVEERVR